MRTLEIRRHAARAVDRDALSPEGQAMAEDVGQGMRPDYAMIFVSPARRAAETVAWFLRGSGQTLPEHGVIEGLASRREDDWRSAAKASGSSRIDDIMALKAGLVSEESDRLASVLRSLLDRVPDGRRGLAVSHSPLIEAGVYGLTGVILEPLSECEGVTLTTAEGLEIKLEELRQ